MFEDLFKDVEDRVESVSIAIDCDSMLFNSCYEYRDKWDIELAYMNFIGRIETIKREFYSKSTKVDDVVLCFTAKSNFRYDLYNAYKAHRKADKSSEVQTLTDNVKSLKKLVYDRIKSICLASNQVEADDLVISLSREKGYWVSAIDKDVIQQSPTPVFNYGSKKWKWEHMGLTDSEINRNILIQTIVGDSSDGFNFVNGYGKVKAEKFVDDLLDGNYTVDEYVDLFQSTEECLLANRLCNMYQYKNGKVVLDEVQDIFDRILPF